MYEMDHKRAIDVLLDNTAEIIIEFNNNGEIILANKSAREKLGYAGEMEGRMMGDILKKDFEQCDGDIAAVMDKLQLTKNAVLYRQNNTCFQAYVNISRDFEENKNGIFALDTEISRVMEYEVARNKEIAAQALSTKNDFVANVTHELRTPVNGIRGHVANLKETCISTEQRKTLNIIERCCDNMSAIINNILDFSKLESGRLELEEREFNFKKMIEHVVETNIVVVNEKGLQLSVNIDENVPEFLIGDELRLTQVLNNLLSNAIKFTSVGFIRIDVTVTLKFNDEIELFFWVADSGIGMSEEDKDKLFQSFSQVDTSITRKYGGTGLGLAITKKLLNLMQGSINVESQKGKGSSFSFSVRLHSKETTPQLEQYRKDIRQYFEQIDNQIINGNEDENYIFGTEENRNEIGGRMEKIVLCIELGAWEKAEVLAEELKTFVETSEPEIKKQVLRLEMAIRKENYDLSMDNYKKLKTFLDGNLVGEKE